MRNLLEELNKEQRSAASVVDGPLMIIAGAGSGKTRTITYRIAYLLQQGIEPYNIMALTFTNKAAKEMKDRIIALIGAKGRSIMMGTFHSVFSKILHIESEKIGFTKEFTIYDTSESKSLLKRIIKAKNLDPKLYSERTVYNRISDAKNNLISAEDYNKDEVYKIEDAKWKRPMIGEIYLAYNTQMHRNNAMDFDDLLFYMNVLLRDNPDVLEKYRTRLKYLLVDEFQDTNYSQYSIVKRLALKHRNICVVGDDAQSIYAFRGANIENIFNFKKDFSEHKEIKLERNYRSTKNIIAGANSVIDKNHNQIKKTIWTDNVDGDKISVCRVESDREEGKLVARKILDIRNKNNTKYSDFAVLYRTNNQSRVIEEALRERNILYKIYGGHSFYQRAIVKDVLAFFRVAVNPLDNEALLRVFGYVDKIGGVTIDKIILIANTKNISVFDVISDENNLTEFLTKPKRETLTNLAISIKSWNSRVFIEDAYELANDILNFSNIEKNLKNENTDEATVNLKNVGELMSAIKDFTDSEKQVMDEETGEIFIVDDALMTLNDFVQNVVLLTSEDEKDDGNTDKVTLMTIHAAKGLEFSYVFIVGVEENLFPSFQSMMSSTDLEEERRLFYVAITRAMTNLTISYAQSRYMHGNFNFCEPSRFLSELSESCVDNPDMLSAQKSRGTFNNDDIEFSGHRKFYDHSKSSYRDVSTTKSSDFLSESNKVKSKYTPVSKVDKTVSQNDKKYEEGESVKHSKFGVGIVLSVSSDNETIIVNFNKEGERTLLTKFAMLEKL
ncbi:DNA helicase [Bacteroidia bacterium]|nr:DNA helicase [Bacteroidia bacterium]